jgi:hypothetical protein
MKKKKRERDEDKKFWEGRDAVCDAVQSGETAFESMWRLKCGIYDAILSMSRADCSLVMHIMFKVNNLLAVLSISSQCSVCLPSPP